MLVSSDFRVTLSDSYSVAAAPQLEAVFIGAAPATAASNSARAALQAALQLGFAPPADGSLNGIPLAFSSFAAFAAAFPADDGWLAQAVQDYFGAGGVRAWVVRVEAPTGSLLDAMTSSLPSSGISIAMQVPSAGLVILPDLEEQCLGSSAPVFATLPTAPKPAPVFRPLTAPLPVTPLVAPPPPSLAINPIDVFERISAALSAQRPDMLCVFALPVGADGTQSIPALVDRALRYLSADGLQDANLPLVQAIAPLLLDTERNAIRSPSGLIAGVLAARAEIDGVWRSIAGQVLPLGRMPMRRIESNALDKLRRAGIAVLRAGSGGPVLDDDILACVDSAPNAPRRAAGARRLMGWLVRNLRTFGEQLVFENALDDGRVELVLYDVFAKLLARGALTGLQVTDAVTIDRITDNSGAVRFDIGVAVALAVEHIELSFIDGALNASFGVAA